MANVVQTKRSYAAGVIPQAGSLLEGQLAVNAVDQKIWIGGDTLGIGPGMDPVLIYDAANTGVQLHTELTDVAGTKIHTLIDSEIEALKAHAATVTGNPHQVTAAETGAAPLDHDHQWADITDPPAEFPPSAHTHLLADVTDSGTLAAVDDDATGRMVGRLSGAWIEVTDFAEVDVVAGQGITVSRPGDGTVVVSSSTPTSIKAAWLWNIATTGDPNSGHMLGDNATGTGITALSFSHVDADGNDVTEIAALIKTGDQLQLLRDNAGTPVYSVWEVTADAINNVTYSTVAATVLFDSDPAGSPAAEDRYDVQWTPAEGEPGIPAHTHSHLTDIDDVGINTHEAIDIHIASTDNPHAVTAAQAGAEPANTNIQAHVLPIIGNPHGTTAGDVGAEVPGHLLGSHGDVTLTTPADQHALLFSAGVWINGALPSGVTVHSALDGLDANDHPQYLLVADAITDYAPILHDHDAGEF